jgi:helix-turn-helix, Psq domain
MPRNYVKKNARRKYTDADFKSAIEAVINGSSIRQASNTYRVPYTTLNSHVNERVVNDQIGRPTKFTSEEESCLEQAVLVLQVSIGILASFCTLCEHPFVAMGYATFDRGVSETGEAVRFFS